MSRSSFGADSGKTLEVYHSNPAAVVSVCKTSIARYFQITLEQTRASSLEKSQQYSIDAIIFSNGPSGLEATKPREG